MTPTNWSPIDWSKVDLGSIDWSTGIEEIPDDDDLDGGQQANGAAGTAQPLPKLVFIDMSRWDSEPMP
jgi:hypothetical protein